MSRVATASNFLKGVAAAATLACSIGAAVPAQSMEYFLQSTSMNTSRTANISGPGLNQNVYLGPVQFTAFEGTSAVGESFSFLGFCVDIFHGISLGQVNLKYDDNYDLTTDSKYLTTTAFAGGSALSQDQILQVGRLVNYGTQVFDQAPASTDKTNKLAALQGAIWQVINPGYTVSTGNALVNNYIVAYSSDAYMGSLSGYGPVRSAITFITETGKYGTKNAHQSFAISGAVPEPATWVMMIGGFAFAGAMLRRSRLQLAAVRI